MASLRLRIANTIARRIVRPRLARTFSPLDARRDFDRAMRLVWAPRGMALRDDGDLVRIRVGSADPDRVILYLHGGGYIVGSPWTHSGLAGRIAALTGCEVILPRYPLAPETPAPAAFDAARAAHAALCAKGYAPGSIVVGGDSAGGGLALALLSELCAADQRPAGLFAFSPWTDLTGSGASMRKNAKTEHIFDAARLPELVDFVTGGVFAADDPRLSPLFAAFDNPPPVLLHVARSEILLDDSRRMADRLRDAGGRVTLTELESAPHVWHLLDGFVPEARASLREAAGFVRACFSDLQASSV
jgi:acetyl esterase/lipase